MAEKLSPFDLANNIFNKTGHLDTDEVGYDPYMTNRILSNLKDTVLFANELNMRWRSVTPRMQYDFYYFGIPKKRRFGKWHKNQDDREALTLIQDAYGFSLQKAKDVLEILRPKLDILKMEFDKGGRHGKSKA